MDSLKWQFFVLTRLFTKLVLEAPVITNSALEVIQRYCEDEVSQSDTFYQIHMYNWKRNLLKVFNMHICVTVACIPGHIHFERVNSETAIQAVPVPQRSSEPQLSWKRKGKLLLLSSHFMTYVQAWHILDPVSGAIHRPRLHQAHVWEGTSEGLYWEVRSHIHAVPGPPKPTLTSFWSRRGHRYKDFSFLMTYILVDLFVMVKYHTLCIFRGGGSLDRRNCAAVSVSVSLFATRQPSSGSWAGCCLHRGHRWHQTECAEGHWTACKMFSKSACPFRCFYHLRFSFHI